MSKQRENKVTQLMVRISYPEKDIIKKNAERNNFTSVSEYLRFLGMNAEIKINIKNEDD